MFGSGICARLSSTVMWEKAHVFPSSPAGSPWSCWSSEAPESRGCFQFWCGVSPAFTAGSPGPCSSFCNSVPVFKDLFLIEFFSFFCLTVHLLFLVLSQGCVRLCDEQYSWMVLRDTFFLLHLYFILSHLFVVQLMAGCYLLMLFHSSCNQPEQCMFILTHFCCCFLNFLVLHLIAL